MPERQAFIDRVKAAERECYAVAAAVNHYGKAVQAGNAKLPSMPTHTSPRDIDLSQSPEGEQEAAWSQHSAPQQASLKRFVYRISS